MTESARFELELRGVSNDQLEAFLTMDLDRLRGTAPQFTFETSHDGAWYDCTETANSIEAATQVFRQLRSQGFTTVIPYDERRRKYWWNEAKSRLEIVPEEHQENSPTGLEQKLQFYISECKRRGFSGPDGATAAETAQSCLVWLSKRAQQARPEGE